MSIRMMAKEMYLLRQEVEALEEQLKNTSAEKQEAVKDLLRKRRAELIRMQRMREGAKEAPAYRRPR